MSTASPRSDVEVAILDLDGGPLLVECLDSLARQTLLPARVLVWDNGSRIPVVERLTGLSHPFPVGVLRCDTNVGFTGGVNAALKRVEYPFVALINNDAALDHEWLASMRAHFEGRPRLAAVQGLVIAPDGTIDGAGIELADGTFRQALHGASVSALVPQPWGVSATATVYRAEALRDCAVGGNVLHPVLFAYYEDVELCARLRAKGWELHLDPRPLATHRASSSGEKLGATKLWLQTRNRYIVNRIHPRVGRRLALYREDLINVARRLARFDLSGAWRIVSGVVAGLMTTIPEPDEQESTDSSDSG